MPEISDYDKSGYDYTKYWKGRQYEHETEVRELSRMLPKKGEHILDIGGSFGRLTPVYQEIFENATVLDYSQNMLDHAEKVIKENGWKNVTTKKGNAYKLPFEDNTFDCVLIVRVLHHIEQSELVFAEIQRVLKPEGYFIFEFANKIHLKATLSAYLKGNFDFRSNTEPFQHQMNLKNEEGIFYNFHPQDILEKLEENGFKLVETGSSSNLRLPFLKQIFATDLLTAVDKGISPTFSKLQLSPSLWLKLQAK